MNQNYPDVSERIKAAVIDSAVMGLFMFGIVYVFSSVEDVPDFARILAFIFIFILYDPLFTSLFGCTIGHLFIGIRVKRINNFNRNVIFPLAIIRFVFKYFLGLISLLTVSGNEKKSAIHDMIVGSIVLYNEDDDNE